MSFVKHYHTIVCADFAAARRSAGKNHIFSSRRHREVLTIYFSYAIICPSADDAGK